MKSIVIIPARMAATRFPGKPLAKIANTSMIAHCFLRAKMAKKIDEVYVATCDYEIADEIQQIGGQVIMTSADHERATDRTAEAVFNLECINKNRIDCVVMLQGDEPLINPDDLDSLISNHEKYPDVPVFNLTQLIDNDHDFQNINIVKLITNLYSDVLAFSREPIPSARFKGLEGFQPKKQLGIISFQRQALIDFSRLPQTPLEKIESIDMMRLIEHGRSIKTVLTDSFLQGVDTPDDAKKVELIMLKDTLYHQYKKFEKTVEAT